MVNALAMRDAVPAGFSAALASCACARSAAMARPPPVALSYATRADVSCSRADSAAKCAACGSTTAYVPKVSMKATVSAISLCRNSASGESAYTGVCTSAFVNGACAMVCERSIAARASALKPPGGAVMTMCCRPLDGSFAARAAGAFRSF